MPAAKIFGEPSSPTQNGDRCKYEDLFWNGKRKSGNFFEVSAFVISVVLTIQYGERTTKDIYLLSCGDKKNSFS